MGKMIISTGRGGAGKSTFAALTTRYLDSPPLLIDLDPDQNLAFILGVDLEKEGIKTISDVLFDLQKGKGGESLSSLPLAERIEYLFHSSCFYESKDFDLISLGTKMTQGCYCAPNSVLRGIIPGIARDYKYTIIDSPAGFEHLNRKVITEVDDIFVILDPSAKSWNTAQRIRNIAREIGIIFKNFYLIANYRFNHPEEQYIQEMEGIYLGKIDYDPDVEKYNFQGKSLLDLGEDSPASLSVKKILSRANYKIKDA